MTNIVYITLKQGKKGIQVNLFTGKDLRRIINTPELKEDFFQSLEIVDESEFLRYDPNNKDCQWDHIGESDLHNKVLIFKARFVNLKELVS